jgi:hypothetical protein
MASAVFATNQYDVQPTPNAMRAKVAKKTGWI